MSSGTKTLINAVLTVGVGATSGWITAAVFEPSQYGSWWKPLAIAFALCIIQVVFSEFVTTPGERLARQVELREETKQEIRTEIYRRRLDRLKTDRLDPPKSDSGESS